MNSHQLQSGCYLRIAAVMFALPCLLWSAEDEDGVPIPPPKHGELHFSLLPKAFQRTPELAMTVYTEMTGYGRLVRTPNRENPVYYVSHGAGYKAMGAMFASDNSPPPDRLERAMEKALATNGYLPATSPDQHPTLVVLYFWGSHYRLDPEMEHSFPQLALQHRLERARLVGGLQHMNTMARTLVWGEFLTDRTARYEFLRDQSTDDLYYVVASAYDHAALARGERKLVWRTTMTANASGVSLRESVTPLIAAAAPFLGRETPEPEIAYRRIRRFGVKIGEAKVVEADVAMPRSASPGAGASTRSK